MRTALLIALFLLGCATTPASPPTTPAPSLDERIAADPTWRPGDEPAVPTELAMWAPYDCPPGAQACAVQMGVEFRNRCGEPARFLLGPPVDQAPPADAPVNELAPGRAVSGFVPSDFHIYLEMFGGRHVHAQVWNTAVFLGDKACDRMYLNHPGTGTTVAFELPTGAHAATTAPRER